MSETPTYPRIIFEGELPNGPLVRYVVTKGLSFGLEVSAGRDLMGQPQWVLLRDWPTSDDPLVKAREQRAIFAKLAAALGARLAGEEQGK